MITAAPAKLHPTTRYAKAVVDGEIVAGEMVRLACARHLRDLERQKTRAFPYFFDEEEAHATYDFFEEKLRLYEGDSAGEPFYLLDWQMFVLGSLYGWKQRNGYRRFQTGYIETGKGSGKSPMSGGIALKGLCEDNEPGAQVFFAGALRAQSEIPFRDAKTMAESSPDLAAILHITQHNIDHPASNSFLRPVSSEAGNLTGKRVHKGIIEELHEHKDGSVISAMEKGTKGRKQPLIVIITNSGMDRRSVCWEKRDYSRRVLTGAIVDEQWFAYVCQLDVCKAHIAEGKDMPVDECPECDQWTDEAVWPKTNPSLPHTPGYDYLRKQVREAANMPSAADETKRLNFCIWTSGKVQWVRPEVWQAQAPREEFGERQLCAGYDLSAVNDITAVAYVAYDGPDAIDVEVKCYLPEERVDDLARASRVPYRRWADEGWITLTPGQTVNYDFIEAADERMRERFEIPSSGIDPWQSIQFRANLEAKDVQIVKVPQTNQHLHAVVEEFERLLRMGGVRHADPKRGSNPVLDWVVSNVVLNIDARGNKRIDKQSSPEKIDPMAAILNALSEAMALVEDSEVGVGWA